MNLANNVIIGGLPNGIYEKLVLQNISSLNAECTIDKNKNNI